MRRPGDTIELEAAQVHEAGNIAVRWPLRLCGNGSAPEDTVLVCPRGADAALVFRCGGLARHTVWTQAFLAPGMPLLSPGTHTGGPARR